MQKSESICIYKKNDGKLYMPYVKVHIQSEYVAAIEDVVNFFRQNQDLNIYSIYLRGSIVFGSGINNLSDLDFFIITKKLLSESNKQTIKKYMDKLNKKYTYITKFDLGYYSFSQILSMKENVLIKLTSICVYGKDIKGKIKNPSPGKDVAISLSLLEEELIRTKKEIGVGIYNKSNTPSMCVWIMKRIVRSGLEIVSEREGCFTRDLGMCFEKFIMYYPDKRTDMHKALLLALKPTTETQKIEDIFENIGYWLVDEGKRLKII